MPSADARRPWRAWYSTPAWRALRAKRLAKEPFCRFCALSGLKTKADTVDHVRQHRGDRALFFDFANTQSLCKACHDSVKQSAERLGYSTAIGPDGLPADPRHPFNR